jgi:hypothetical protein
MLKNQRIIIPLVTLLLFAGSAPAWVTDVDPSSASFPLVGRGSASGYTGEFNWSETVMTVPGRNGLDVNLVLTYSGNIGVDQESSWVGVGYGDGLSLAEGEVVGLVGPNGAGKTTTLRVALDLARPNGGEADGPVVVRKRNVGKSYFVGPAFQVSPAFMILPEGRRDVIPYGVPPYFRGVHTFGRILIKLN